MKKENEEKLNKFYDQFKLYDVPIKDLTIFAFYTVSPYISFSAISSTTDSIFDKITFEAKEFPILPAIRQPNGA